MFILGHLGIGAKIVSPFSKSLPLSWVYFGTILPDVVDKPLFFIYKAVTEQALDSGGLISGTKTIGHTALLTVLLLLVSVWTKNKRIVALVLGLTSHLVLDMVFEHMRGTWSLELLNTFLWPTFGTEFYTFKLSSAQNYIFGLGSLPILMAELIGAALLAWELWKGKRRSELLQMIHKGRAVFKRKRQVNKDD